MRQGFGLSIGIERNRLANLFGDRGQIPQIGVARQTRKTQHTQHHNQFQKPSHLLPAISPRFCRGVAILRFGPLLCFAKRGPLSNIYGICAKFTPFKEES